MDALGTQTLIILTLVLIWTLPFKGVALWMAARRGHLAWFIIMLVLNTLAILEIIYIVWVGRQYTVEMEMSAAQTTKGNGDMDAEK